MVLPVVVDVEGVPVDHLDDDPPVCTRHVSHGAVDRASTDDDDNAARDQRRHDRTERRHHCPAFPELDSGTPGGADPVPEESKAGIKKPFMIRGARGVAMEGCAGRSCR